MPRRGIVQSDRAYDYPPPGLLLVFGCEKWDQSRTPKKLRKEDPGDVPVRPLAVAGVISVVEELYVVSFAKDAPPPSYAKRPDWAWEYDLGSLQARLSAVRMESDLHLLLDLPWPVYVGGFTAFTYGLAHVFGVPYKAVARFHKARKEYWESRREDEEARQQYFDFKKEQAAKRLPFELREVHETPKLPPPGTSMELPPPDDPEYPANG